MQPSKFLIAALVIGGLHLAMGQANAAPTKNKNEPSQVTPIPGTTLHRVALKESAVERLGIKTDAVREAMVTRKRVFAAEVLDPAEVDWLGVNAAEAPRDPGAHTQFAAVTGPRPGSPQSPVQAPPGIGLTWVRALPSGDSSKISRQQPARVLPLLKSESFNPLMARRVLLSDAAASGRNRLLYQVVDEHASVLRPKQRVLIELSHDAVQRKVVPFSAIFYDEKGQGWLYTVAEARVYVRHAVQTDYISQDRAFLIDGPAPGTEIVTVGAPLLYGTEFDVGH